MTIAPKSIPTLSRIACFVVVLIGLCFVWPRFVNNAALYGQPVDWETVLLADLCITIIAILAVRLTNVTFQFSWPARLAIATVTCFAGLITLGVIAPSDFFFWAQLL